MTLLDSQQIMNNLKNVENWNYEGNEINNVYQFRDFMQALTFVNKVGDAAEKMNHHPDIFIHSWNKVRISISTHSEGGVTEKDFKLASIIDKLAE